METNGRWIRIEELQYENVSTGGSRRENDRLLNPETDKLMLMYGQKTEAHYQINELARLGLNRVLMGDASGAFRLDRSVSVFCNDVTHEQNPGLNAHVTVNLGPGPCLTRLVVPIWDYHNCSKCPPLCECGQTNRLGEKVVTCSNCLKVIPMSHGQGYFNPFRVSVPQVVRLQVGALEVKPTGSSVERHQAISASYRHQVVVEHNRASLVSLERSVEAFRQVTGYAGKLERLEGPQTCALTFALRSQDLLVDL